MMFRLPYQSSPKRYILYKQSSSFKRSFLATPKRKLWSLMTISLAVLCLSLLIVTKENGMRLISPLLAQGDSVAPLSEHNRGYEVLGFAPWWTFNKLENVDFSVLTTFAYFGIPVDEYGDLDRSDQGYHTFKSDKATAIFTKAHAAGTRVVLTVTQMDNDKIKTFLDNQESQENAINQIIAEVQGRGIDGINIDFEYAGNPGEQYKDLFSVFVANLSNRVHSEIPGSRVSISVYASSAKAKQLYDIERIAQSTDMVFMMAYDFAVAGSDMAAPTAPLYGKKEGIYGYDISTAVDDFLKKMPAEKLVLGVPYYGYNYPVYKPQIKGLTRPYWEWRGKGQAQTYTAALTNNAIEKEGWDDTAKVGWKAYFNPDTGTWRMIFLDDERSLGIKYDFAKEKGLKGVGMWALGFDNGRPELWALLKQKFGEKLANNTLVKYN